MTRCCLVPRLKNRAPSVMIVRQYTRAEIRRGAHRHYFEWRVMRMPSVSLLMLAFLTGASLSFTSAPAMPVTLFTFNRVDESNWQVVNDGVMGGRSFGAVAVADGHLRFSGTLVTQGGGFTSIRTPLSVDLRGAEGLELRVRGSGRPFEVEIGDGTQSFRRNISRRAVFPTAEDWTVVSVPFTALRSTIFGRTVTAPPLDLTRIRSIGLYIIDGRDGPFWLELDYIKAYGPQK